MNKNHKVEIFQDSNSEWRWHLKSGNGKILADSGEGYKTKWSAKRAVNRNLAIDESKMTIVYPLIAILLIALIWALATRTTSTTQVVTASKGTQSLIQKPTQLQDANNTQPSNDVTDEAISPEFIGK